MSRIITTITEEDKAWLIQTAKAMSMSQAQLVRSILCNYRLMRKPLYDLPSNEDRLNSGQDDNV